MSLDEFFNSNLVKVAELVFHGRGVSFNAIYSAGTWQTRSAIKNKFRAKFLEIIEANKDIRWMDKYIIDISYNSRHDPDNIVAMEKIFVDTLKQKVDKESGSIVYEGFIKDDSKHYCKGVILRPDDTLPYNSFKFDLYEYN